MPTTTGVVHSFNQGFATKNHQVSHPLSQSRSIFGLAAGGSNSRERAFNNNNYEGSLSFPSIPRSPSILNKSAPYDQHHSIGSPRGLGGMGNLAALNSPIGMHQNLLPTNDPTISLD